MYRVQSSPSQTGPRHRRICLLRHLWDINCRLRECDMQLGLTSITRYPTFRPYERIYKLRIVNIFCGILRNTRHGQSKDADAGNPHYEYLSAGLLQRISTVFNGTTTPHFAKESRYPRNEVTSHWTLSVVKPGLSELMTLYAPPPSASVPAKTAGMRMTTMQTERRCGEGHDS